MRLTHNCIALLLLLSIDLARAETWHVSLSPLPKVDGAHQFRTINEATKRVTPGDLVLIHDGAYRETVTIDRSGTPARPIRIEAAPNANVVVTGADLLIDIRDEGGNVFSAPWQYRFLPWSKTDAFPDDEYHRLIGRPEQVFVDGYPLQQTLSREAVGAGTFFVDFGAQRLFFVTPSGEKPAGTLDGRPIVEASTRATLLECKGANVIVRGIHFRYAANGAQHPAVALSGRGDTIEDCVVERTSGVGLLFGAENQTGRRCVIAEHGELGFSVVHAHNLRLSDFVVRDNNTKGFNRGWECGGTKIVLSRGVEIAHCQFMQNRGQGIWFDIGDEDCTVHNCLIADNEDAGICCEISYGLRAVDNVILGNGLAPDAGGWGVQAGISISSSPGCVVRRNLLVANKEGFSFREQVRTTPRIGRESAGEEPVWNHDERIEHNVIAYNRDAQAWGWFDASDERHWPRALQDQPEHSPLSLEQLRIRFANNVYATADNQPLFIWGPAWTRHAVFDTLVQLRRSLGFERGGRVAQVEFANYAARDFRLPAGSEAVRIKCYPRGDAPGVLLGLKK